MRPFRRRDFTSDRNELTDCGARFSSKGKAGSFQVETGEETVMEQLTVVGIGAFERHLTKEAEEKFRSGARVILQTERCYLAELLGKWGVPFESMDECYQQAEDYEELNGQIVRRLIGWAEESAVVYAVPGSVLGKEVTSLLLREAKKTGLSAAVIPGTGYGEAALAAALCPWDDAARIVYGTDMEEFSFDPAVPLVIQELDNAILAGQVKLALMEYYPDELEILLATVQGDTYSVRSLPLYELDRQPKETFLHTTCVLVPPVPFETLSRRGVNELMEILHILRAPGGCPWDREQTIQSLRSTVLEEAYEVAEAIDLDDDDKLCEELGDLLLQVGMLSCIAADQSRFTLRDVTTGLCAKLIYRHPHVFGDAVAADSAAVLKSWEQLKKAEKHQQTQGDVLRAVPRPLPALTRSAKVQKKAAQVGFDWAEPFAALEKVREETEEFAEELRGTDEDKRFEELGDLLFAVVNTARLAKIDPELALTRATEKFTARFCAMEETILARGKRLEEMTVKEMDAVWDEIKHSVVKDREGNTY